jgi:hypothetical protein
VPFNGSGTYTLPAADLPVSGQVISSTKMNSIFNDLATALTNCVAKDGQSTMTGALKMGSQRITGLGDGAVGTPAIAWANDSNSGIYRSGTFKTAISEDGTKIVEVTTSGVDITGALSISNGLAVDSYFTGGVKIGYKAVPKSSVTSGNLSTSDVGKCVAATGNVTFPAATFNIGDTVSVYNNSGSSITVGAGFSDFRLAGTSTIGTRTLAARGMCTVWFLSTSEAIASGSGLT